MLKKFLPLFIIAILLGGVFVASAAPKYGLERTRQSAGYGDTNVYQTVNKVVSVVLSLLGIIFFAITMYAGLRWMTAQGNDEHITKAKTALIGGIIGMAVIISSYAITRFAFSKLVSNVVSCVDDSGCPSGQSCINSRCILIGTGPEGPNIGCCIHRTRTGSGPECTPFITVETGCSAGDEWLAGSCPMECRTDLLPDYPEY